MVNNKRQIKITRKLSYLYLSMREEKSLYVLSTAATHALISLAWACPFSPRLSASDIRSFTLSLVSLAAPLNSLCSPSKDSVSS